MRPKRLPVTDIEHWLRDPYTIYAKHILKLRALDPVDTAPGARDRGTVIHKAIGDFTEKFSGGLPADPLAELMALGRAAFEPLNDYPEAKAFWWPRFDRIARWFIDWELERRLNVQSVYAEVQGTLQITPDFMLTARADRIEQRSDGTFAVLDYKTGRPPSPKGGAGRLRPAAHPAGDDPASRVFREGADRRIGLGTDVPSSQRRRSWRRESAARLREL